MRTSLICIYFVCFSLNIFRISQVKAKPQSSALVETVAEDKAKAVSSASELDLLEGGGKARISRNPEEDGYEDVDVIEQQAPVAELIPLAETRKARGNGADLSVESVGKVVPDPESEGTKRDANNELVEMEAYNEKELDIRATKCTKDTEACQENANCCSGFCSWTRNFTCFTVTG